MLLRRFYICQVCLVVVVDSFKDGWKGVAIAELKPALNNLNIWEECCQVGTGCQRIIQMCTHIIHRQTAHKHFNQANNGEGGDFEVFRILFEHRAFLSISSSNVVHVQCSKASNITYFNITSPATWQHAAPVSQLRRSLSVSRCIAMLSRDSAGPVCSRHLNKLTMIEPLLTGGWVGLGWVGLGDYHQSARVAVRWATFLEPGCMLWNALNNSRIWSNLSPLLLWTSYSPHSTAPIISLSIPAFTK